MHITAKSSGRRSGSEDSLADSVIVLAENERGVGDFSLTLSKRSVNVHLRYVQQFLFLGLSATKLKVLSSRLELRAILC